MNPNHPRFPHRLLSFGLALFTFGASGKLVRHPIPLAAAWLLCVVFAVRFALELRISGEERESDVEPTLSRIALLNQFSIMVVFFGLLGFMRER